MTDEYAYLTNGVKIHPVMTMRDEYGGTAHVWIDDGCYIAGIEKTERIRRGDSIVNARTVEPITHIFPELFSAMLHLPELPVTKMLKG